ncbi:hypothetical protein HK099_004476 [Clydaea vesicula]|uniref:Selenoprotein O n=1 Tax=Clydaea vesicula TaxID=447962 RepID=A0AAD5XVK9_9FUNG|nr:hypothetical protein HK099_004476 [Clydaea vesicula]
MNRKNSSKRINTPSQKSSSLNITKPKKKLTDLTLIDNFTTELTPDALTPTGPLPHLDNAKPLKLPTNVEDADLTELVVKTSRMVKNSFYTFLLPEPCPTPVFILNVSNEAVKSLELDPNQEGLSTNFENENSHFEKVITGRALLNEDSKPWAQNYSGHQFGFYSGQLGDGRCVSLGEVLNSKNERFEIQLKGAGRTPYSRFGDGYCSISSCVREYLCSEVMYLLKIPTSRVLGIAACNRFLPRDKQEVKELAEHLIKNHYTELNLPDEAEIENTVEEAEKLNEHKEEDKEKIPLNVNIEKKKYSKKTILTLKLSPTPQPVMKSFSTSEEKMKYLKKEKMILDNYLKNSNQIEDGAGVIKVDVIMNRYAKLFLEVVKKTAILIANWQAIGFCHGVMNTDNMSILGLTIDYGPFGFFDSYDPSWTSNASDSTKRYTFDHQPKVALWNLSKLGRCFIDLVLKDLTTGEKIVPELPSTYEVNGVDIISEILKKFENYFSEELELKFRQKLGLKENIDDDLVTLINPLMSILSDTKTDYTKFFRTLSFSTVKQIEDYLAGNSKEGELEAFNLVLNSCASVQKKEGVLPTPRESLSDMQAALNGANELRNNHKSKDCEIEEFTNHYLPSQVEIRKRLKNWFQTYKERILLDFEMDCSKKEESQILKVASKTSLFENFENEKALLMKQTNPKYSLRNWALMELNDNLANEFPNIFNYSAQKNSHALFETFNSNLNNFKPPIQLSKQKCKEMIERVLRIFTEDLYGEISDSDVGWKNVEDRKYSEKLYQSNVEDLNNLQSVCFS